MLGFPESIDVWGTFYFGVHVAAVVLYLVGQIVPTKKVNAHAVFFFTPWFSTLFSFPSVPCRLGLPGV